MGRSVNRDILVCNKAVIDPASAISADNAAAPFSVEIKYCTISTEFNRYICTVCIGNTYPLNIVGT